MSGVRRVAAGDLEIEVEEAGEGDRPLVLVHGFTGSRDDFLEQIPRLAALGRTVAIDQRGHGGSTNTGDEASYRLEELADDLDAALTALGIEQCDLLGHSLGGMVALRFTLAHAERVRSLVLMDTIARPIQFMPPDGIEGARAVIDQGGMAGLCKMLRNGKRPRADASLRFEKEIGSDAYWGRIEVKLDAMDPAAFLGLGGTNFASIVERLPEIDCPTLVMVGEQDFVFLRPADEMEAGIPGARRVTIPDAAHSPQHENPDAWFEAVREHLVQVRA